MAAHGFPSTCWSRILGSDTAAEPGPDLEALARTYWKPVFGYIRARWATTNEDAKDRTQEFFVWMLESGFLQRADPNRGRFRGFLKTSLRNFLTDLERRRRSAKRGGGRKTLSLNVGDGDLPDLDVPDLRGQKPDEVLDALWRTTVVERATDALERELTEAGKQTYFEVFRDYYLSAEDEIDYETVSQRFSISRANVSNYLMYAKKRYRALLRRAVLETVSDPEELERELRWLFGEGTA